jgi:parvulin-like peptidyl-prolyl isomerase
MKTLRFLPLPLLLALGLLVAGCGGSSKNVPQNAVAVVGSDTITKAQYNDLLASAKATYKARNTTFPKVGTSAYKSLSDQAVTYLVQESELEQKAKDLGVAVTDKDVQTRLDSLKQQYFQGDQKKYQAQLKSQGLTEAQLKQDLRAQILSEKLYDKVTADVKVTDKQVSAYYAAHQSTYHTPKTRQVAHILVSSKAKAQDVESQLQNGADFAKLAKQFSTDTSSKANGGKLCVAHGSSTSDGSCISTVPPFDKAAFSLKTGEISQPVHSTYGWHVIKALAAVKPAHTTPLKQVKEQIRQSLLSTAKTKKMTTWVDQLKKDYASKVSYQAGYTPAATTTATTGTGTIAATTG